MWDAEGAGCKETEPHPTNIGGYSGMFHTQPTENIAHGFWTSTTVKHTIFLWSDAAATIYFTAWFVQLLFEGSVYFFINDSWIGYKWVRRWWLLDTVSSTRSLSVLLSAVGTTRTTQTVLALAWWPLSEIIRTCVRVPRLLAAATIQGQHLFHSRASGCAATIWGQPLIKGGAYLKKYGSCMYMCVDVCSYSVSPCTNNQWTTSS